MTPSIRGCVSDARLAVDGAWPVLAGTLDQAESFLAVFRQVKNEDAYWKSYLTPPNG